MSEEPAQPVGAIRDLQQRVKVLEEHELQWSEAILTVLECIKSLTDDVDGPEKKHDE